MSAPNVVFEGKTIVLGGDFRQTLAVKKGASKEELIVASITESHLWPHFEVYTLKENMQLLRSGLTAEEKRRSEQFAKWLLDMGNGEIGEPDAENEQESSWVTISLNIQSPQTKAECRILAGEGNTVTADEAGMSKLIDFIYDDTTLKAPTTGSLRNDEAISLDGETSETYLLYPRQFRTMSAATIASLKIGQENCILEAKVYQRWISKSIPEIKVLAYCCILIDREITVFEPLPGKESEFPDDHFELISYHQLPSRVPYRDENSKLIYPILTVHFTCEGMITSVQENRDWNYPSCSECSKASTHQNDTYIYKDHGRQDSVTYRYKFKAAVTDRTATAQHTTTCLIEEVAHTIVSTITTKKSDTKREKDHNTSARTTAEPKGSSTKRLLLSELLSSTKKRKED
ncbi:DNA helicase [Tanacetum coccineum]